MKGWVKKVSPEDYKYYDYLTGVTVLIGVLGFIIGQKLLFIPTGLLLALIVGGRLYDRYSGKGLKLYPKKETIRMFPEDKGSLTVRMANSSKIPFLNGQLMFRSSTVVKSKDELTKEVSKGFSYTVPLSLISKGETAVKIPLIARHRGISRIYGIEYRFPHLTRFSPVIMQYVPPYPTEVIVYPEQKHVHGVEEVFQLAIGDQTSSISPYEDMLTPIGTREYVSTDPFHRIHWKASAKTQELQTKILERQVDISWTILINVASHTRLGNQYPSAQLEDLLSYASYLCNYTADKNYTFEMAINMRRPHSRPYYYLPEGSGPQHVRESLELLARVSKEDLLMPFEELTHRMNQQLYKKKTVLIIGEVPSDSERYIKEWQMKGIRVFHLAPSQASAVLVPIGKKEAVV